MQYSLRYIFKAVHASFADLMKLGFLYSTKSCSPQQGRCSLVQQSPPSDSQSLSAASISMSGFLKHDPSWVSDDPENVGKCSCLRILLFSGWSWKYENKSDRIVLEVTGRHDHASFTGILQFMILPMTAFRAHMTGKPKIECKLSLKSQLHRAAIQIWNYWPWPASALSTLMSIETQ